MVNPTVYMLVPSLGVTIQLFAGSPAEYSGELVVFASRSQAENA